jgi:tellurite resistance protein TerC
LLAAGEPTFWHWAIFSAVVALMLALDLVVFQRRARTLTLRDSALATLFWVAVALAFNALVWWWRGAETAVYFLTGYLVEWSLSMDNVFVFALIFNYFKVPLGRQHRVLFWGVLGAIVLRLVFVLAGSALLEHFDWITWIFGAFLIYTGVMFAFKKDDEVHPERNLLIRIAKRFFTVSTTYDGPRFFVREEGRLCATPLFVVLLVVEGTDLLFAVDSVPAIFGITRDPFIVFSSNIFAVLGLRALYFLLAGVIDIFHYLNYGLAAVLSFVGAKMIAEYWWDLHFFKDYPWASLVVIAVVLGVSIGVSLLHRPHQPDGNGDQQNGSSA